MNKKAIFFIIMCAIAILTTGCANLRKPSPTPSADPSSKQTIHHTVSPGDRLSDIALRYTGDASLWKTIAAYNNVYNPRNLKIGDVITIPAQLLSDNYLTFSASSEKTISTKSMPAIKGIATSSPSGSLAVQRTSADNKQRAIKKEIVLEPVTNNRSFQLRPLGRSSAGTPSLSTTAATQVKVIGSYYPKGIYKQPANYSTLIMRAAPGTLFEVQSVVNNWYKISTEHGVGFLRTDDGKLMTTE